MSYFQTKSGVKGGPVSLIVDGKPVRSTVAKDDENVWAILRRLQPN